MKTKEQIIKSRPVYLYDWEDTKKLGVISDFEDIFEGAEVYSQKTCPDRQNVEYWKTRKKQIMNAVKEWKDIKILFAAYTYENYSGSAFVLFVKNGTLYEVNGGHCSCNGLEGQWEPEKVNLKELNNRMKREYDYTGFDDELRKFLGIKK